MMAVIIGNAQDIGSRDRQEDCFSSTKVGEMDVSVLADGMGGYESGDQASAIVTQGFINFIEQQARKYPLMPDLLVDAAYSANAQLALAKQTTPSNMGSTLVAVLVRGNHAWWVSIGDSLLYLWRDGRLQKLNADHSHYQDLRQQVFLGQLSSAQAANDPERNGLTSALMGREMRHVDISRFGIELQSGDIFLLASDGLATLSTEQIAPLIQRASDMPQLANALVKQVIKANSPHQDNVSVMTLGIHSSAEPNTNAQTQRPTPKSYLNNAFFMGLGGVFLGGIFSISVMQMLREPVAPPPAPAISPPTPHTASNCLAEQQRAKAVCEFVFAGKTASLKFCPQLETETKKRCDNDLSTKQP